MRPTPTNTPSSSISALSTFLILVVFLLALFPGLFVSVVWAPWYYVFPASLSFTGSGNQGLRSRWCVPPHVCVNSESQGIVQDSAKMSWTQKTLTLPAHSRGSYLITSSITSQLPELRDYKVGLLHLFIQHTSCALSLNENWDEDVRADMSDALDRIAPEDKQGRGGQGLYRHDAEGSDDMPAHIKSALIGASVTIPISNGKLATGTWQGIWYLEFRASKHARKVVATIQGEKK